MQDFSYALILSLNRAIFMHVVRIILYIFLYNVQEIDNLNS